MIPTQTVLRSQTPISCSRRGYRTTSAELGSRHRHTRRPAEAQKEGFVISDLDFWAPRTVCSCSKAHAALNTAMSLINAECAQAVHL